MNKAKTTIESEEFYAELTADYTKALKFGMTRDVKYREFEVNDMDILDIAKETGAEIIFGQEQDGWENPVYDLEPEVVFTYTQLTEFSELLNKAEVVSGEDSLTTNNLRACGEYLDNEKCLLEMVRELQAREKVLVELAKLTYGYLWHINAGLDAPAILNVTSITPEKCSHIVRKLWLDVLTKEQRGEGINKALEALANVRGD